MSDIFLSYSREDQPTVERLAGALEAEGWSVWWDRSIPAGRTFDEVIEEAIDASRCVVVAWSETSVKSRWVRTEAGVGAAKDRLVPMLIEDVQIPLAFRRIQAADLSQWDGGATDPTFQSLVQDIRAMLTGPLGDENAGGVAARREPAEAVPSSRTGRSKLPGGLGLWLAAGAVLVAVGVAALVGFGRGETSGGAGTTAQRDRPMLEGAREQEGESATGDTLPALVAESPRQAEPSPAQPSAQQPPPERPSSTESQEVLDREPAAESIDRRSELASADPPTGTREPGRTESPSATCADAKAVVLGVEGGYRERVASQASRLRVAPDGCWRMDLLFQPSVVEEVQRGGGAAVGRLCNLQATFRLSYLGEQLQSLALSGSASNILQQQACLDAADEIAVQAIRQVTRFLDSN